MSIATTVAGAFFFLIEAAASADRRTRDYSPSLFCFRSGHAAFLCTVCGVCYFAALAGIAVCVPGVGLLPIYERKCFFKDVPLACPFLGVRQLIASLPPAPGEIGNRSHRRAAAYLTAAAADGATYAHSLLASSSPPCRL